MCPGCAWFTCILHAYCILNIGDLGSLMRQAEANQSKSGILEHNPLPLYLDYTAGFFVSLNFIFMCPWLQLSSTPQKSTQEGGARTGHNKSCPHTPWRSVLSAQCDLQKAHPATQAVKSRFCFVFWQSAVNAEGHCSVCFVVF